MLDRSILTSRNAIIGAASLCVVLIALVAYFTFSVDAAVTEVNMTSDKVAIRGYDTVAYFTDGKATKGKKAYDHVWHDARWLFASATNRDLFAANPDRYAPRYGGYCSMGLAMGEFSDADPEVWSIVDGKLYLNKAKWVQDLWRKGTNAYITASDINWNKNRSKLRINDNLR